MASSKPKVKSGSSKGANKRSTKPSSSGSSSKVKHKSSKREAATKSKSKAGAVKKPSGKPKRRVYTEKELNVPKLNQIVPAGVSKPKGKKKGKVFVDDQESMMTLLAMVNAEKEGQIESKMARARQMEEIRQARQQEMDKRQAERKVKLVSRLWSALYSVDANALQEDTKDSLRRQKNKKPDTAATTNSRSLGPTTPNVPKKRVSFG